MQAFLTKYYQALFAVLILAIAGFAFYCGMLYGGSTREKVQRGIELRCAPEVVASLTVPVENLGQGTVLGAIPPSPTTATLSDTPQGAFAGSKNGTKYYTPDCAGLERIKPENRIWFQTIEDATLQGYTPANC